MPVTVSLSSLLTPYTESGLQTTQLGVLAVAGFATTSWHETSVPRVLVKATSRAALDVANYVPSIAAGGLLDLAEGDWLTLLASANYLTDRTAAVATRRTLRLTNNSGSAVDVDTGTVVQSAEGLRYRAVSAGTIAAAAGSTLDLSFEAEETGDEYDVNTASWELVTAIAGVAVSEPAVTITVNGSDEETDTALRARCREKWSTLGAGANVDAYKYWAKNTPGVTETITRVKVREAYPLPGQVTLYLATDSGTVNTTASSTAVTQVGSGPAVTLTGTPVQTFQGRVEIDGPGAVSSTAARGTATFRYSLDGGITWSAEDVLTAATYALGDTGVTLNFAAGSYVVGTSYVWTSTASTVQLVQDYIDPSTHLGKAPNCVDVIVTAASEYTLNLTGTITVSSASYKSAVESARTEVFSEYVKTVDVGGTIYVAELIQRFMDLDGVINVAFTSPASDTALSANQVLKAGTVSGLTVST